MINGMSVDMETAQFSYELALAGVTEIALEALNEMPSQPSIWHPFKRSSWNVRNDVLSDLVAASSIKAREQRQASQ